MAKVIPLRQHTLTTIWADGTIIHLGLERAPELSDLQDAVNGFIQMVPDFPRYNDLPCTAYVDEEGMLKHLPINIEATNLWRRYLLSTGRAFDRSMATLYGPVVISTRGHNFGVS